MAERQTQARFTQVPESRGKPSGTTGGGEFGAETAPKAHDFGLPDSFLEKTAPPPSVAALAPSNYLPEISFGDETLLNTTEFRYSTFFVRMKRQIEAAWDPWRVIRSEELPGRQYVTIVTMTLTKDGAIDELSVLRSSGIRALDEVAVAALRRSAPYLNPPPGLVEEDGRIRQIPRLSFIVSPRAIF